MDDETVPAPEFGLSPGAISDNLRVVEKLNATTTQKENAPLAMAA